MTVPSQSPQPDAAATSEAFDELFMQQALALAENACGRTRPNPPVGAVVVKAGGVIGRGAHMRCGCDHAEAAALKDCADSPKNATVYCTLEPCSKPGRVGACCDALVAAGVDRVVWACRDPNPKNSDGARAVLEAAGIRCLCLEESPNEASRKLAARIWRRTLRPFAKHVTTGMPFVQVKLAMSLDGKICDNLGKSQWISGPEMRAETGDWRAFADVVMVGGETVRRDDPSLLCHTERAHNDDLWRAVVSRSGNLPKDAQIFTDSARDRTLVYGDAAEAVRDLGRRGFMHVLCEGGLGLARSLAHAGLVDAWDTIMCPMVIGELPIERAMRFGAMDVSRFGSDALAHAANPGVGFAGF